MVLTMGVEIALLGGLPQLFTKILRDRDQGTV